MLLVKSGGEKEVRICFGTQVIFLIFHDKQKLGIWGNRALKARRTKNEEHRSKSSKLLIDKVRGAITRFTFVYGFMYG